MSRIRLLIADDHALIRVGLRALFEAHPDIEVVAETPDGPGAVSGALEARPDVAVLDYSMPGLNGAEVAARLRSEAPGVKVLVLSGYDDRGFVTRVLQTGARGYLLKTAPAVGLVQAVRTVAAGGVYLEPALAASLAENPGGTDRSAAAGALSGRENDVLRLLAVGYTTKEIGAQLEISVKTVETYKARAMEKLQMRSRVDLMRYASRQGWLSHT
jgi:DNA-binding NarL/FixJ family response regulator